MEQRSMLSGDLLIRDLDIAVRVPADREPFRPGQRHRNGGLCAARVRRKREMRVRIQNERFFIRELLLPEPGAVRGRVTRLLEPGVDAAPHVLDERPEQPRVDLPDRERRIDRQRSLEHELIP